METGKDNWRSAVTTADGHVVSEGARVFDYYNGYWGTIGKIDSEGWFDHYHDNGERGAMLNGERVCVRIPAGNPFYKAHSTGNPD